MTHRFGISMSPVFASLGMKLAQNRSSKEWAVKVSFVQSLTWIESELYKLLILCYFFCVILDNFNMDQCFFNVSPGPHEKTINVSHNQSILASLKLGHLALQLFFFFFFFWMVHKDRKTNWDEIHQCLDLKLALFQKKLCFAKR